ILLNRLDIVEFTYTGLVHIYLPYLLISIFSFLYYHFISQQEVGNLPRWLDAIDLLILIKKHIGGGCHRIDIWYIGQPICSR
ncbi:hypothetical protein ACJX0J_024760, partial [Zea mays]